MLWHEKGAWSHPTLRSRFKYWLGWADDIRKSRNSVICGSELLWLRWRPKSLYSYEVEYRYNMEAYIHCVIITSGLQRPWKCGTVAEPIWRFTCCSDIASSNPFSRRRREKTRRTLLVQQIVDSRRRHFRKPRKCVFKPIVEIRAGTRNTA